MIGGREVLHRAGGGAGWVQEYEESSPVSLAAENWVSIEVRYREYDMRVSSHLSVKWASDSAPPSEIPTSNLRPLRIRR